MNQKLTLLSPSILPIFRVWLIFIVGLFVISPTDIPISYRIILLLTYPILFFSPYLNRANKVPHAAHRILYRNIPRSVALTLILISAASVAICIQFYTGRSAVPAVLDALQGVNTYGAYQAHFREASIGQMPAASRAIFVLMLAIVKLIFVFLTMNVFLSSQRSHFRIVLAVVACALYISFGLARGTFFEVFEVACVFTYFWFSRSIRESAHGLKRSRGIIIVIALLGFILIGLFILNAMRRYDDVSVLFNQCSPNFCNVGPPELSFITYPLFMLSVYFGNGAYFFVKLVEAAFMYGETAFLLPGHSIFANTNPDEFGVRGYMCEQYVACRFVWTPEVVTLVSVFGLFTPIVTNLGLLWIGNYERFALENFSRAKMALAYFLFVLVISLPVANFFTISTPSILASGILLGWILVFDRRKQRRIRSAR